jgi:hypothetical protein
VRLGDEVLKLAVEDGCHEIIFMIPPDGVVGLDLRMGLSIDLTLYSRMRCPKTHSVTELRDCPDVGGWGGGGGRVLQSTALGSARNIQNSQVAEVRKRQLTR